jgi:23S rRNA (guanosine2251-2'-O)-methyltransferase
LNAGGGRRGSRPPAWRPRRPARAGAGPDVFVVGGKRAVTEAVRSGLARRVLVVAGSRETEGLRALADAARRAGVAPETVGPEEIDGLGLFDHQGVAAFVTAPKELDDRSFTSSTFDPEAVVVILDGIVDPQNFGACARSAEAAGAAMLVTRKRRAAPLSAAAVRASAGALLHVPVARIANLSRALERLSERGFFVVGLDHRSPDSIHDAPVPPRPMALVVGAEEAGISRLVLEGCDQVVSIPMAGRTASLNVSAALAVGLFGFVFRPP